MKTVGALIAIALALALQTSVAWFAPAGTAAVDLVLVAVVYVALSDAQRHAQRHEALLRAIVEDYVQTSEPVGSKALVDRHSLGVSSATIRNDMAVLEDEGLITAPHTSAGRVPTDKGYRVFVDRLSAVKPLSGAERRAIHFLAAQIDARNLAGVGNVIDRIRVQHDEVGGLPRVQCSVIFEAQEIGGGRGHRGERLRGGHPGFHHQL